MIRPGIVLRTGLALTLAAMLAAVTVGAAPSPDSAGIARLEAGTAGMKHFRVVTHRREFLVSPLRFDAAGIEVESAPRRVALLSTPDAVPAPRRVDWSEVEHVDGRRSHALGGAVIGAVVGCGLGFALQDGLHGELHDAATVAVVMIPIGALVGGIGGLLLTGMAPWQPLYP